MEDSMTLEDLERALADARRNLERAQSDQVALADANQRFHDFSLAVQGLQAWVERLKGESVKGSEGPRPVAEANQITRNGSSGRAEQAFVRPRDAILRLTEAQPREWALNEIVATMEGRGWLDTRLNRPIEAVRAAANRLVDVDKVLERVGRSSYRRMSPPSALFAVTPAGEEVTA